MKEYKTFLKNIMCFFLYIIWPLIIHFIYESHQTVITQARGFARSYMPYLLENLEEKKISLKISIFVSQEAPPIYLGPLFWPFFPHNLRKKLENQGKKMKYS